MELDALILIMYEGECRLQTQVGVTLVILNGVVQFKFHPEGRLQAIYYGFPGIYFSANFSISI
jgi:hypothetical protein